MMKIEQIRANGTRGRTAELHATVPLRSNVVSISGGTGRVEAVLPPEPRLAFALGRKGRQARIRQRLLEGFFISTALGTAALIWWSAK